ncbi:hypothetical protein Y032_0813g2478 [Ancylostoma ceylanicum]|uniref:Uncharacterized protein n=1 Tax=Ancylostoma ceylanicum TaxID=53326 RepID=A0A016WC71_9BILA|nr:hypothetical protein Y032_0813g2478 [Ancylostoma ceylanicum]
MVNLSLVSMFTLGNFNDACDPSVPHTKKPASRCIIGKMGNLIPMGITNTCYHRHDITQLGVYKVTYEC